jgi:hypothetical protein
MRTGRCECGAVRYAYHGEPLTCYACHCTDCQAASGSAFTLSMIVKQKDLVITDGEVSVQTFVKNGTEVKRHHCEQCGTAFWYAADSIPELCALKPGTLDDKTWFWPIAHLWLRSTQPWVSLDPSIRRYDKQPSMRELVDLWSRRNSGLANGSPASD